MKRMYCVICSLMLLFVSCNHKEFCYHHPHTARIRINVDWSKFDREQPTGMSVMVFPAEGGEPSTVLSNTLDHVYVNLEAGLYHTLVFNQSVTEFGSFSFQGMDQWEDAEVVVNSASSRWYGGRSEGERVATEPEWLGTDAETDLRVTDEMIAETATRYDGQKKTATDIVLSSLTPRNIIYTLCVKVNIPGGIYNLRSARAALEGLAEGVKLATRQRSDQVVTQLLENWTLTVDKNDPTRGYIKTSALCFGLPSSHQGVSGENAFLLSMLLVDGKTKVDVPFEVGHLIKMIDDEELILSLELTLPDPLPDVKPEGGSGSGFDATVEDWGDEIEHDIQM